MTTAIKEMQAINKNMTEIAEFVRERTDTVTGEVKILQEENTRLAATVTGIQEKMRERTRADVARAGDDEYQLKVQSGPYAGFDLVDMALVRGFAHSQRTQPNGPAWGERAREASEELKAIVQGGDGVLTRIAATADRRMRAAYKPEQFETAARGMLAFYSTRAAMDSTTAGFGDELVPTLQAADLWMDVNLQTLVAPLITTVAMPSNPFDMATQLGDVDFYPGAENIATTSTRVATAKVILNAFEIVGQIPYSFTLEEDAVIAMLPEIRAGLVRNIAELLDDLVLNADTNVLNNINADGTTISKSDAGKAQWLIGYDGLIKLPLVDNTGQSNAHGTAVSDDMFNEIRAQLGKYGARPSELAWVMDVNTFIRSQSISNFRTMDKLGPNATLLTGMLGAVEGIPVIVSEQMLLTASDGKITDGAAGTVGRLLIFNRSQWRQGFRREMTIDVDRDSQKRQTVVTVSFRHALVERSGTRSSAEHTALQYNITGV